MTYAVPVFGPRYLSDARVSSKVDYGRRAVSRPYQEHDRSSKSRHAASCSKFPRVPQRISASARIDRKKCSHRKGPCPSRRFFGRPSRLAAVCSQPMQPRQRRLVLDIPNTRLIRKNDHACSPPFRFQVTSTASPGALRKAILACAPRRDTCPWLAVQGAGLSQRGFLARARTQESSSIRDVMKAEPF